METLYTYHQMSCVEDNLSCLLRINALHDIFKGHFPDKPLLPGVCMVQMMIETLSIHRDTELRLKSASMIKFINMWLPEKHLEAEMNVKFEENDDHLDIKSCVISADGQPFFKFKGRLHVG